MTIVATSIGFIYARKYSKNNPIEKKDLEEMSKDVKTDEKWEEVGMHRQLGGFLIQLFIGLLITSMISFRTLDVIFSMTGGGPSRSTYVLAFYIIDQLWIRVNYGTGSAAGVIMLFLISSFSSFYIYLILKKR